MQQNEKRNNDQDDFYFLLIHTSVLASAQTRLMVTDEYIILLSPTPLFLFTKYICKLLTVNLVLNVALTEYSYAA